MKFPARSLAVQILAAALCLCVPGPAFAADIAPSIAASAAPAAGVGFDPLFHQELQVSFDRLFPQGALAGVPSLQALRVMRSEYDFAARAGASEPAAQARAEAAEFLSAALKDDARSLAERLSAAGVSAAQSDRITAAVRELRSRAGADPALAKALSQVSKPIPVYRPGRLTRAKSMILQAARQWRSGRPQVALVTANGVPVSEALQADRNLRQMRSSIDWPEAPRLRAFSTGADWVPTSKKVARLQKLAGEEPETAFAEASQVLADQKEARLEVRAASLRIVAAQPAARAFPIILKVLDQDPSWYLKRMAARWIGAHASELSAQKDEIEKTLKPSYRNSNPSVRLMTRWALERFGVDPGPEIIPSKISDVPAPAKGKAPSASSAAAKTDAPNPQLTIARKILKWAMYGISLLLLWSIFAAPPKKPAAPPPAPQTQSQTQAAPAPAADPALSPEGKILADINKNLEQLKDAQQKQTAIAEKQEQDREQAKAEAAKSGGKLLGIMLNVALMILPIGIIIWFMRRQMGGGAGGILGSSGGDSKINVEHPNVRFSDVAGVDDALKDVRQIIDYLDNPGKFKNLGAHAPRGVLLEGPPGTGKTLLARALAGEANAAFLSMKGSDFIQMFVGLGAMRVRELFNEARKNQPAIIFIDEIDAIGGSRDYGGARGGDSEHRQTLVALLAELDGFLKMDNVIVVAATNRSQDLDEALMRPGRFDRKIFVGNPDVLGREAILAVHGAKIRLGPDADVQFAAQRTPGLSGAAMANIINESALQAAMREGSEITQKDLQRAVDKETFGDQRNLFLDEDTKKRVAEHEAGHALTQYFAMLKRGVKGAKVDNKITIIPHGKAALGYAEKAQKGEADTYLQTQDELEADIVSAMGGRAAEETIYPGKRGISTGPGSDIADHADRMARVMVEQLGMSEDVGIINAGPDPRDPMGRSRISEMTKYKVEQAIKKMTGEALAEAKEHIRAYRGRFDRLVKALIEKETLYQDELAEILGKPAPGDADQAR